MYVGSTDGLSGSYVGYFGH